MHDLFDQSITIAQNTCNHRESLSVVIDEAMNTTRLRIEYYNADGWKCRKEFQSVKAARAAWEALKAKEA